MRKTKRVIVVLLIIMFLIPSAFNVLAIGFRYEAEAVVLNELGIYAGGNPSYFDPDLGSEMQRQSAIILLVKMFGGKDAALAMTAEEIDGILSKYSDNNLLAPFARPFMAYAIKSGMVEGTSGKTLGPTLIDSPSFACMILKNMGYTIDTPAAFIRSLDTLGGLGGMKAEDIAALNNKTLIRDDIVGIIYWALRATTVNGETLIAQLVSNGVIPLGRATELGFIRYDPATGDVSVVLPEKPDVPTDKDIIYDLISNALLSVSSSVKLPVNSASDTTEEVRIILEEVLLDNPRILYYTSSLYHSYNGLLELNYLIKDTNTIKTHMSLLDKKVESIIHDVIKTGMTDYQKELAIHDYIINHCSYDLRANPIPESYTGYGALCLGKAVCTGYAEATQLLLQKAGLECQTVTGKATNQNGVLVGHSWNIVKVEGQYYHIDTTWDDPVMKDGSNYLAYTYFNLTDIGISKDHSWDGEVYPACNATACNFYVYNGLIVNGSDAFVAFVIDKVYNGSQFVTVKVGSSQNPGFDVGKAIKTIQSTLHTGIIYTPVNDHGIIDITVD